MKLSNVKILSRTSNCNASRFLILKQFDWQRNRPNPIIHSDNYCIMQNCGCKVKNGGAVVGLPPVPTYRTAPLLWSVDCFPFRSDVNWALVLVSMEAVITQCRPIHTTEKTEWMLERESVKRRSSHHPSCFSYVRYKTSRAVEHYCSRQNVDLYYRGLQRQNWDQRG